MLYKTQSFDTYMSLGAKICYHIRIGSPLHFYPKTHSTKHSFSVHHQYNIYSESTE